MLPRKPEKFDRKAEVVTSKSTEITESNNYILISLEFKYLYPISQY